MLLLFTSCGPDHLKTESLVHLFLLGHFGSLILKTASVEMTIYCFRIWFSVFLFPMMRFFGGKSVLILAFVNSLWNDLKVMELFFFDFYLSKKGS